MTLVERFTGDGEADSKRCTKTIYNWKGEAETIGEGYNENTKTAKVIRKVTYDYQGREAVTEVYDETALFNANGKPASLPIGKRRSKKERLYDELGRVYQSKEYGIDQTDGAQGAAQTTLYWYGPQGNLIKQQHPNGAFTKSTYDALGRKTHNYLCYQ